MAELRDGHRGFANESLLRAHHDGCQSLSALRLDSKAIVLIAQHEQQRQEQRQFAVAVCNSKLSSLLNMAWIGSGIETKIDSANARFSRS